jgi:nicotinamidase/pyrazinamidase
MKNTALLIVDVQHDFVAGGALEVKNGDTIIHTINKLQDKFDLIVATQDWHPENHKSFASQHKKKKVGDLIKLNGIEQFLWPDHCIENTFGSELVLELNQSKIEKIIQKGNNPEIDSYSGFFENDKKTKTELDEYLLGKDVDTVYICGLATDYCVKYTAIDAAKLGYETYLIEDACKGVNINPDDSEKAISEMKKVGVIVANSKDI